MGGHMWLDLPELLWPRVSGELGGGSEARAQALQVKVMVQTRENIYGTARFERVTDDVSPSVQSGGRAAPCLVGPWLQGLPPQSFPGCSSLCIAEVFFPLTWDTALKPGQSLRSQTETSG